MTDRPKRPSYRSRLPKREQIFASRWSRPFAPLFDKPYFWTLNRRQAAVSVAVGMFCGLMPGPTQMMSALIIAYFLRTNLPVAVFTTLYTNPVTYMPLYYAAYKIGSRLLGVEAAALEFPDWNGGNFLAETWAWLAGAGKPLLVGVPVLGSVLAVAGYITVLFVWRLRTAYLWKKRNGNRTEPRKRHLTAQEIELARLVFSDGIDYTRVKIYRGIPCLPALNVAVSPNGHIYFPRRNCPGDFACTAPHYAVWLVHELTHVWQYQHGYRTWLGGLMLSVKGGYRKRCCYAYPPPAEIRRFADLNMEQQADLVAHYYAARFLAWPQYRNNLPHFETVLDGFLKNPHDTSLLPKYRNNLSWFGWLKDALKLSG